MEKIRIQGMSCQHCVAAATKALTDLGLENVSVNLDDGAATFSKNPAVAAQAVKEAIKEAGFTVK